MSEQNAASEEFVPQKEHQNIEPPPVNAAVDVDFSQFQQFQDAPNQQDKNNQHQEVHHQQNKEEEKMQPQLSQQDHQHNLRWQQQQPVRQHQQAPQQAILQPVNMHQQQNHPPQITQKPELKQDLEGEHKQNLNVDKLPERVQRSQQALPDLKIGSELKGQMIVHQAQNERLASTYSLFVKYNTQYKKTVDSQKLVLKNVRLQLANRQDCRKELRSTLIQYFQTDIALNKSFYEKSYKIQKEQQQPSGSMNKLANIKEDLKEGFEGLFSVRKSLADQMHKLEAYINSTIKRVSEAFEAYQRLMNSEERKQSQAVDQYFDAQKGLQKILATIQKLLKKGIKGERGKQDIFIWIVKFINEEKEYRKSLIRYGKTLIELRKTFIAGEKQLFSELQTIINEFKLESRKVYAAKEHQFVSIQDYLPYVEKLAAFEYLCTITDIDYIKSVLEIQNRKEFIRFKDEHFITYLELPFFDNMVGNKKDLFKGAINKFFPLLKPNELLVHTISGNIVEFNKETDQCKQKYFIRNLNARLIGEGAIQFDELIKGIIFSENRTARFKLQDNDRAEELICYLNEKREIDSK